MNVGSSSVFVSRQDTLRQPRITEYLLPAAGDVAVVRSSRMQQATEGRGYWLSENCADIWPVGGPRSRQDNTRILRSKLGPMSD